MALHSRCLHPSCWYSLINSHGVKRLFFLGANLALWSAAAINGSRGSWIAISAGILVFLLILLLSHPRQAGKILVLLILALGAFLSVLFASDRIASAVEGRYATFSSLEEDKSYMIRQLMNQKALRLFEESPIIGIGPGRFMKTSTSRYTKRFILCSQEHFDVKSAHNSYLSFLAENGLLGSLPLVILLILLYFGGIHRLYR